MNTTVNSIAQAAAPLSDSEIMEAIVRIDEVLAGLSYQELATRGGTAEANKIVRAGLYQVLDDRYPSLDAVLEAWLNNDEDPRSMTQVYADALTAHCVPN
jgi:hypothetical protein